jgi:hypothetical protein
MEPLTLIWTALERGAQSAAQSVASKAIKDAYQAFKGLVRRKLRGKPRAHALLGKDSAEISKKQKKELKAALEKSEVHRDPAVLESAQKVMTVVDPKNAVSGKYSVRITGNVQGLVQGDNAQVSMTFGTEANKKNKK